MGSGPNSWRGRSWSGTAQSHPSLTDHTAHGAQQVRCRVTHAITAWLVGSARLSKESRVYSSSASISWRVSSPRPPSGPGPTRPRRVGVTLRRLPWLGVTLRPVRLVTDVDVLRDRLRRLSVEDLFTWKWCELMRMMLPPLCPVSSDLGLPTQVQDFLTLLPNLVFTLLQSCLSLECTVTPKFDLRLIARRFRGLHHAAWRWCWRLPRSSAGTGSWWHSNGPTSSVRGLSRYRCYFGVHHLSSRASAWP